MTSGSGTMRRREFSLPAEDVEYLDATGFEWEAIVANGVQWLLILEFVLPEGYAVDRATLGIRIVPGYPAAALDMVYLEPTLTRSDGKAIPAVSSTTIDGRSFQQWSRHYTAARPWRSNVDDISTHVHAAEEWLRKGAA